ncbi:mucin-2-like isoform X1 [Argiope bruennichi]|uniref:mucin-2-like isoform X1 n=2 Tax=Argiope bruennichi TaxID=94029 RepID=UPI0024950999|nr:mucin-2-like isoform X1 [Argiope bruennichi]
MPFRKWNVEPVFLCRKPLPPDKSEPCNFYPITNTALVNCLRQLSSVAKIANKIFEEIGCECRLLAERSERLKDKITTCEEIVSKLNAKAVQVPRSDLSETARRLRREKPYATKYEQTTQLFLPSTRPPCVDRLYNEACVTPVAVMCTIDRYRTDGLSSSELFMVTPILGGTRKKRRKLLDIETRKPANFSLAEKVQDRLECGTSSLPPLVSPSRGYILKQNESLELERLPSPEEQAMLLSLEYPSVVVPVDTSETSFNRMSLLRRSLLHMDFVIKRKKTKKRSKRRHTFCEGDTRELDQAIRNVTNSSCQTDDFLDVTSVSSSSIHNKSTLSKRRSRSVQDTSSRRRDLDLDSLKQDSAKDSATEDDKEKSPAKTSNGTVKKSLRSRAYSSLTAAISIAAVKMRNSTRGPKQDDGRSSSGNWSASSSTRASVDSSDPTSPSRNSVGKDSLLSSEQHDRSKDDILPIQSLTSSPVKKKKFGNTGLSWEVNNNNRSSSNTPTPEFASLGSSSTPLVRSPYAGRRTGVSDDGDSSVYSVDTDGYYTSMHTDSGLWSNPLTNLKPEDVLADLANFRQRQGSHSSENSIDNSSINSFLSKSATECSSNSDSVKGVPPGPPPPPRVSSSRTDGTDTKVLDSVIQKLELELEDSDKSYSPHPPNGSASESEHEVRDRIRVKTEINPTRYPSMCAVSPETSDDEIADWKRRTIVPNLNVVIAEVHREDRLCDNVSETEEQSKDKKTEDVQEVPKSSYPSINMYRSETPVPSSFSSSISSSQPIDSSTPRSGINVTTFSPEGNDTINPNLKTGSYQPRSNLFEPSPVPKEIVVIDKPVSPILKSDKSLIPLKYAQRITVTPIARSDSSSSCTGTIKRNPLKPISSSDSKTEKSTKSDGSPSYVSFKAPDSPVSSVSSLKVASPEGKLSSPTSSLPRPVARVTLDPTGKVVYSSNSLERPSSANSNSNSLERRTYATLPMYQANSSTNRIEAPQKEVQNSDLKTSDIRDGCDDDSSSNRNLVQVPQNSTAPITPPPQPSSPSQNQFSSFKSSGTSRSEDFTFRPSRGGRFCRSYFPSHLLSSTTSRNNQQSPSSPSSSPVLQEQKFTSKPAYEYSAGRNYSRTNSQIPSYQRNTNPPQSPTPYSPISSRYVPKSQNSTTQGNQSVHTPTNSPVWPNRINSPATNNRYSTSSPRIQSLTQKPAPVSLNYRPLTSLSPPDLIPAGESPPSTLDITSPASTHRRFIQEDKKSYSENSKSPSHSSPQSSVNDKTNLKSLSANELFAIIHSSKKKHNIKSESEISMSPMSSRSVSPALSQSSLSKIQPVETGVLSRRYDNSPDRSKWCNSMPSTPKSMASDKLGTSKPTSMHDFKMLLLQTRTGSNDSSPRPSAAELLKVSPPKSTPSTNTNTSKVPVPSSTFKPPNPIGTYSPGHGTVPMKRNARTRSPYLTRYDSAYPPIIEDCSEEMEESLCLESNPLPYKAPMITRNLPQSSTPVAKATSTWV